MKKRFACAMVLLLLIGLGNVCSAITTEGYNLTVGTTTTLYLNASESVTSAAWISTEPNAVQILSQTSANCRIKVESMPDASPVIVYCDYYYTYKNPYNNTMHMGQGRKDFYIYVIGNGGGQSGDSDYITVTFDANGGSLGSYTMQVKKGSAYGSLPIPSRSGYLFDCWVTSTGDVVSESTSWTNKKDHTLTAQWRSNTYSIYFNGNGSASGSMSGMTCQRDTDYKLPFNTYARSGCQFVCWNTKSDGSGTDYSNGQTIRNLSAAGYSVTLYAVWKTADQEIPYCNAVLNTTSYTYDGKAKEPTVTVRDGRTKLTQGKHYKLTYKNNVNGGTGTVTIQGIGNYSGSQSLSFTIDKADQTVTAAMAGGSEYIARGKTAAIKASGYGAFSYTSGNTSIATVNSSGTVTGVSIGTTTITVTAAGNRNYNAASTKVSVTVEANLTANSAGEDITWTLTDGQLKLTGKGPMLQWPYSTRTYTAEHAPWYGKRNTITSIVISQGITNVTNSAFTGCVNVKSISVPKSVTSIDAGAFRGMNSLKSLTVPFVGESRTATGSYGVLGHVFGRTTSSTEGTTRQYYDGYSNSMYYYIPSTLRTVKVTDATALSYGAFYGCSMLTQITLPGSLTRIGDKALYNCSGISQLALGNKLDQIGASAFYGCSRLISIAMPASVTYVGSGAFENCSGLGEVRVSDIAAWCRTDFQNATANPLYYAKALYLNGTEVKALAVPSGVTKIEDYAFYNAEGLTSVSLPSGLTAIGDSAFRGCGAVTALTVPKSVTGIGAGAFRGMNSLKSLTVPFVGESRTATGSYGVLGHVFGRTTSSTEGTTRQYYDGYSNSMYYYIPSTLRTVKVTDATALSYGAFYGCSMLTQITLPGSLTRIGDKALYNCSGISQLALGNKLERIGTSAFYGCSRLTSIAMPASVTYVGSGAFENCGGLTGVYISDMAAWCRTDFQNATANPLYYAKALYLNGTEVKALAVPSGVTKIEDYAFYNAEGLTSVSLPSGLTAIGDSAFRGCGAVTALTVPKSVTSISERAFQGMNSLKSLTVPFVGQSRTATDSNGVLGHVFGGSANSVEGTTRQYYDSSGSRYYYIPSTLRTVTVTDATRLSYGAFYNCSMLTQITLPGSLTWIGGKALYNCSGISQLALGNKLDQIGASAFYGCSKLTSIAMPASVAYVGSGAFENCSGLTGVYVSDMAAWCRTDFQNATANPLYYAKALYLNGTEVNALTVPSGVTKIEDYAFYNAEGLTSVSLPSGLTAIGYSAFGNCGAVTALTVPESVTGISEGAFRGMNSLKSLTVPFVGQSRTATGSYGVLGHVFGGSSSSAEGTTRQYYNSSGSKYYYIPSSLRTVTVADATGLSYGAFYGCSMLTQITLPDGLTQIGAEAFSGCTGLSQMAMPGSLKSVGGKAFAGCTGLKGVYIGDLTAWCGIDFQNAESNPLYNAKKLYVNNTLLTALDIPWGTTRVGRHAFVNCTGIKKATVPKTADSIGLGAFRGLSALTEITLPFVGESRETSVGLARVFGYIFGYETSSQSGTTQQYYSESNSYYYYIPATLKTVIVTDAMSLPYGAFYNCTKITKIRFECNLTQIGENAFKGDTLTVQYPSTWDTSLPKGKYGGNKITWKSYSAVSIENAAISAVPDQTFTGVGIEPDFTVTNGGTVLAKGTQYTVEWENNVNVGTATVTVYGFGTCIGKLSFNFNILPRQIGEVTIGEIPGQVYTGEAVDPMITVLYNGIRLVPDADYVAGYTNANNALTFNLSGKGNFTGTARFKYTIFAVPTSVKTIGNEAFSGIDAEIVYIHAGVTRIDSKAFANCRALKHIHIAGGNTAVADDFVAGCPRTLFIELPAQSGLAQRLETFRGFLN